MKRPSLLAAAMAVLAALSIAAVPVSPTAVASLAAAFTAVELPGSGTVLHETGEGSATYVAVLQPPPLATYEGGLPGLAATSPRATGAVRLDADAPASRAYLAFLVHLQDRFVEAAGIALGGAVEPTFRYTAALNGVALELTPEQAATVSRLPGVDRVVRETPRWLDTDNGPDWIGADVVWGRAADTDTGEPADEGRGKGNGKGSDRGKGGDDKGQGNGKGSGKGGTSQPPAPTFVPEAPTKGEGVVVGIIDTGINHDHPSFAAEAPDGYVHTNPRDRYYGVCAVAGGVTVACNDKLIGIYDFTGTGPEDDHAHGSHVAGTAAGNALDATLFAPTLTVERSITGVAPRANLISYKGCSGSVVGCQLPALLGAINQAVLDGVDVINYSIGGGSTDPWTDLDALSFLGARAAGIVVATSAGNSGPGAATVGSPGDAPWVMTVAASTHDRALVNRLTDLQGPEGPLPDIEGKSLTAALPSAPIVYAGDFGNALCAEGTAEAPTNPYPAGTFDGKIVLCDRGVYARVDKATIVAEAGAVGMVLANDEASGDSLVGDAYDVPGVHISYTDGLALREWIDGDTAGGRSAAISGTTFEIGPDNADVTASFSSRGPNPSVAGVIKPDLTGPGVDILAPWTSQSATAAPIVGVPLPVVGLPPTDTEPEFGIMSGTSMSSPHLAGAAALMVALHPDWSPAAIQSALMTTAFDGSQPLTREVRGPVKEDGVTPADPFDVGAGRVALERAHAAALVLDEDQQGYLDGNPLTGGDPTQLNLPSLGQAACEETCTWIRTVTSTATDTVTWIASGQLDGGAVTVTPAEFTLEPGASQVLEITADVSTVTGAAWRFGAVRLLPDGPVPGAHLPVAVQPVGAEPGEGGSGEPAQGPISETVLVPAPGLGVEVEPLTMASFTFEVREGFDNAGLQALAVPDLPADIDLFLDRRDGDGWVQVAEGTSGSLTEERLSLTNPSPGEYRMRVVNWAGALTTVDVTITFVNGAGEPGVGAPEQAAATQLLRAVR